MKARFQKVVWAFCAAGALLGFFALAHAAGAPGTAGDPVVSLSYLQQVYTPSVLANAQTRAKEAFGAKADELQSRLRDIYQRGAALADRDALVEEAAALVIQTLEREGRVYRSAAAPVRVTLRLGDILLGKAGMTFSVQSGQALVQPSAPVGCLTLGYQLSPGMSVRPGQHLMVYEDGSGVQAWIDTVVTIMGSYRVISYSPRYEDLADALRDMGLFRGTGRGYELSRPATRLEALVIMIRLLGEEQAALAFSGVCPFSDVPDWGKPYVAYAFERGYTKGSSATLFDAESAVTPAQYITFVLRALGYSDGDFRWDLSPQFAVQAGLYSNAEIAMTAAPFYRDQVVYLSYYALEGQRKEGGALLDALTGTGAVSPQAAQTAVDRILRVRP